MLKFSSRGFIWVLKDELNAHSKKLKDTCHFSLTVNDCVLERETTFMY